VEVTIFHQDELKNLMVKLAKPKVTSYQLKVMDKLNENQRTLLANFFGDE